ncbi:hypothetical protein ACGFK1_08810 [Mycobacterium sp. NPDC048908]|uniref:hypothetical protein n=1 Tax=Mycobacterium sp. NPDC048908 TaxID=3364292 RepID=UPI00371F8C36
MRIACIHWADQTHMPHYSATAADIAAVTVCWTPPHVSLTERTEIVETSNQIKTLQHLNWFLPVAD